MSSRRVPRKPLSRELFAGQQDEADREEADSSDKPKAKKQKTSSNSTPVVDFNDSSDDDDVAVADLGKGRKAKSGKRKSGREEVEEDGDNPPAPDGVDAEVEIQEDTAVPPPVRRSPRKKAAAAYVENMGESEVSAESRVAILAHVAASQ